MNWLFQLHKTNPPAQAIGLLAVVCMAGMVLGNIKIRGIGLGTSGVLFAGILVGSFSKPVDHETLQFIKEFGMILFIFTIGLQLGPGFFAAMRRQGLKLNALALASVLLGTLLAMAFGWFLKMDPASMLGMLAGATTNTPSLGAVQQTMASLPQVSQDRIAQTVIAYAVSYPAAIVAIIGTLLLLKSIFRIDPVKEAEAFAAEERGRIQPLEHRTLIIDNPNLAGLSLDAIPGRRESGVTISRHRRIGQTDAQVAAGHILLSRGDAIVAVGTRAGLDQFQEVVGRGSGEDLHLAPGNVTEQRLLVTRKDVIGMTVGELELDACCGAVATRVARGEVEMAAGSNLRLQFGDVLQVVGDQENLKRAATLLGNSVKEINETQFVPLFVGIFLGIIVGTIPLALPGLPRPIQLGLGGGLLIVALVLGRIGCIGRLVWYMPMNTNLAFREFGIALFLAAIGLEAGPKFFSSVFSSSGLQWLGAGLCVTVVPLLIIGLIARWTFKLNFVVISGVLAGSVNDTPALTFAVDLTRSDSPALAYATVYPLVMLLRILFAQVLALTLIR